MSSMIRRTALATVLALAAGSVFAKDNAAHADASFMKKAAESGLTEVEAAKLAVSKATHTQVKGFAQQMIDDHTKANEELKALAAAKNVTLPTEPGLKHKAQLKLLDGADGAKFDERYAKTFGVKAHDETVRLFQQAVQKTKDAEVKAFAEKTLPKLQHHLEMAKDLNRAVAGDKGDKADKADKGKAAPAAPAASR